MSRIGRRIGAGSGAEIPRYIKHPAGSSGNSWLAQNDPIDAGTAHIIDSNISHLSAECARHLVWDHTVGATAAVDGWDADYSDSPNANGSADGLPWIIAWDNRTARCYPLPAMIADRDLPEGGLGLREIRVQIYADVNTDNSLRLFAAITPTEAPPTEGSLALATAYGTINAPTTATSGLKRIEITLRAELPAGPPREEWVHSAGGDGINAATVPVHAGYLWVGWKSSDAANEIHAISAYEVPGPITVAPNEAGGMLVWYRADTCSFDSDSYYANVSRLLDLSGNERHADFVGGTKAFYGQGWGTVLVTGDGAAPMLYFQDGSQYSCPHESALNPTTWTMFFVWNPDGGSMTSSWVSLFNKGTYTGGTGKGFGISDRTHSGAYTNVSAWVDTETTYYVDHAFPALTSVLWVTYDGNTLQLFRNNISVGTVAKVGYLANSGDLVVGGMDGDLGNQGFCGAFGECGLYDRVLTNQERNDLWMNYFKPRYQL